MKYILSIALVLFLCACKFENPSASQQESNKATLGDPYLTDISQLKSNPSVCTQKTSDINWQALQQATCNWLSDYNLFVGLPSDANTIQEPGLPYHLNSALFTDHANKYRYIVIPDGTSAMYNDQDIFEFPEGTVLIKVFALPQQHPENDQDKIVEVRLQIRRSHGWVLLPYVWHPDSDDAYLHLSGKRIGHTYFYHNETIHFEYQIPSANSCQICHQNNHKFEPIGPKARHLNGDIVYQNQQINQLQLWQSHGILNGLPTNLDTIDTAPNWQDQSQPLPNRAKAYLDINCAHCHSDGGSAALSGLRLEYWRKDVDYHHGVCNSSHGWRGGGFDIWPGEGEASSIPRRMRMTEAKDRMPPIGRTLVDDSAVQLMEDWINSLPYEGCGT